jgi:microcystin-dependent protein
MSQFNAIPQAGPKTGAEMADAIQDAVDAINSGHIGTGRPSYAVAGTVWHDDVSSTVTEVYVFDGTTDILLYSYNPDTGALIETELAANQVTLDRLQQISTQRILGRTTASTGNVESLTATQVTAMLNAVVGDSGSGGTKGLVPAPGAGDAAANYFLKADGTWSAPPSGLDPGTIVDFAMETPPTGYLLCYGQQVSRATYAALYSAVGDVWGAGNGSTTFNLPDFRGRVRAGMDDMGGASANRLTGLSGGVNGDNIGAVGGTEAHTLDVTEMPSHSHATNIAAGPTGAGFPHADASDQGSANITSGSAGGGLAHNNVQPTAIVITCIKF